MPLAEVDWRPEGEPEQTTDEVIQSMFWDLRESQLDGWRPFSCTLLASDLYGPVIGSGHGIDFRRNMMFGYNGPRGAAKTCSLSYNLSKILRVERPVWTNYPISFYVDETNGLALPANSSNEFIRVSQCHWVNTEATLSYYESMPLDMDKFYTFNRNIRNGAVGIDELQYFVEARTSGRYQNRVLGYQIMQIRKTANTFGYTVQNQRWVDNRFGWSADYLCECNDVSKKTYDRRHLGRELMEGEVSRWTFKDISGVLTGEPYDLSQREIGPYQFDSRRFWGIYPTHFVIDIFEAMAGPERDKAKNLKRDALAEAVELVANEYLEKKVVSVPVKDFYEALDSHLDAPANHHLVGKMLATAGVKAVGQNEYRHYDFSEALSAFEGLGKEE